MTDTNDGRSSASSATAFSSIRSASSVFGGKSSKDSVGPRVEEVADPGHGIRTVGGGAAGARDGQAAERRSTHQMPTPAVLSTPSHRPGQRSHHIDGREVDRRLRCRCCSPTRPHRRARARGRPLAGTGSSSPGRRAAAVPDASGSASAVGQAAGTPRRSGASRSISRATSTASTRRHRSGEQRRVGADAAAQLHADVAAAVADAAGERVGDDGVALGRRPGVPLGRQRVEEGGHLRSGLRRPTGPGAARAARRVMMRIGWSGEPRPDGPVAGDLDRVEGGQRARHQARPARRSAASTRLRKSIAMVVGPDPADARRDPAGDLLARLVDVGQERAALVADARADHDAAGP